MQSHLLRKSLLRSGMDPPGQAWGVTTAWGGHLLPTRSAWYHQRETGEWIMAEAAQVPPAKVASDGDSSDLLGARILIVEARRFYEDIA